MAKDKQQQPPPAPAPGADVEMGDAQAEIFSIPILETVKAAQLQNGLRHRDFQRYRQYCTRRLRRIRKSTKFTHGKGKVFINKKVDAETATDARLVYLPLYSAERAWSYAMQLKEDDNLEKMEHGDDANSRIKFHLNGRLRKAAEWSQRLAEICAVRADARTSLEAEAYAAFMMGNLAFHREEHERALDKFGTSRRIFSDLSKVGTLSQKDLFRGLVEELEPFIRFCEHRLTLQGKLKGSASVAMDWSSSGDGASNALLQSKIDVVLLEARKQKVAALATISWKQKQVAVPNQEIGLALLRPEEIASKLDKVASSDEKKREAVFLELLSAYDNALHLIKTEIAKLQQQSKSGSALVHTEIEALQSLEEYVRYLKLTRQVERTVAVYKQIRFGDQKARQLGDLTHVLDMLVQSVAEILKIPGLAEHEKLISTKYTAYQALFRSIRAATIAQSYLHQRKFSEAISLYQYASGFLAEAEETLSVHPAATDVTLQEFIKDLGDELVGAQSRTTAQSFLHSSKQEDAVRKNLEDLKLQDKPSRHKSLLERQDEFIGGTSKGLHEIIRLPPSFQPIPCKPILFDMAFNELSFPDISQRMKTDEEKQAEAAAAEAAAKQGSGGFFGWFRK